MATQKDEKEGTNGSNRRLNRAQRSAMEVATYAQIKKLHKRLGFSDNANMQAVRFIIAHLWFAAQ